MQIGSGTSSPKQYSDDQDRCNRLMHAFGYSNISKIDDKNQFTESQIQRMKFAFSNFDILNEIYKHLDFQHLIKLSYVSKEHHSLMRDLFIETLKTSAEKLKGLGKYSIDILINFLGTNSVKLVNLNLGKTAFVINTNVIRNILTHFPILTSLSLRGCTLVEPKMCLELFTKLPLKILDLSSVRFKSTTDHQCYIGNLDFLKDSTSLTSLDISNLNSVLKYNTLTRLTNLTSLNSSNTHADLRILEYCTQLVDLNIAKSGTTDLEPFKTHFKHGKFTDQNGHIYEGHFTNGQLNGSGSYTDCRGRIEGNFIDNFAVTGTFFSFGNIKNYEGEFFKNTPHGQGIFFSYDGKMEYMGSVSKGNREGFGTWYSVNGDTIQGNFYTLNSKEYCEGVQRYYGKPDFKGTHLFWISYHTYLPYEGEGIYFNKKKEIQYEGEFHDGSSKGNGIGYYGNGNKIQGNFFKKDRDIYCQGKRELSAGTITNGLFQIKFHISKGIIDAVLVEEAAKESLFQPD